MCASKNCCVFIIYLAVVPRILCADPFVNLIIDGTQAETKEFPSMVSIQYNSSNFHFCGGSLIGWNHILTAAHCVVKPNEENEDTYTTINPLALQIMAGDIRVDDSSLSGQLRYPIQIFSHPDYDPDTIANDVAVIRVYPSFIETPYVKLITLDKSTPEPNRLCVICGWGSMMENFNYLPIVLRKTEVEIKSNHFCNSLQSYGGILPKFTICAGSIDSENLDETNKEDACQGDSGGPLMCQKQLTGIISFGKGCGEVRYPGIYTDVSKFRSWIEDVSNQATINSGSGMNLIIQWLILYKI